MLCSLFALPLVVLLGDPDHRLPPGVALLQFQKSLGHLSEGELGLHYWQDLGLRANREASGLCKFMLSRWSGNNYQAHAKPPAYSKSAICFNGAGKRMKGLPHYATEFITHHHDDVCAFNSDDWGGRGRSVFLILNDQDELWVLFRWMVTVITTPPVSAFTAAM